MHSPSFPALPGRACWPRLLSAVMAAICVACGAPKERTPSTSVAARPGEPLAESREADRRDVRASKAQSEAMIAISPPAPVSPAPAPAPAARARLEPHAQLAAGSTAHPAITPPAQPAPTARDGAFLGITTKAHTPHPVKRVAVEPVSTFSVDVDTGSYSSVRGLLNRGLNVPPDAVRVEEMLNYFSYDYPRPESTGSSHPFAVHSELTTSPWNPSNVLLKIGIQATDPAKHSLPAANLVFLVDVSGSMGIPQSLPLVREALLGFVEQLREQDRVSIVTYSGTTQVLLESVPGDRKDLIRKAISALRAGGSTAGASGLRLAYEQARRGFLHGGINRILLATDGDFNVGVTGIDQLRQIVAQERKSGIGLSTLGVGHTSYNDALMEQIADAGDGKYSFIDSVAEARKVLVDEFTSTLATVAQDVKLQLEFNPAVVKEYRLIGYDNRALAREDFNNDQVDAGDIGAGHRVTALYELTLQGQRGLHDDERYAANRPAAPAAGLADRELGHLKLRYKAPGTARSVLIEHAVGREVRTLERISLDTRFAVAVAAYGQLLRGGTHLQPGFGWSDVRTLASGSLGPDPYGQRREFLSLVDKVAGQAGAAVSVAR